MFFSKMHHTDNPILRTLIYLPTVKYEIMGLAAKYGLNIYSTLFAVEQYSSKKE